MALGDMVYLWTWQCRLMVGFDDIKTSFFPNWFCRHICEIMSSLKKCFPLILQGAECFLNCLSSTRLDHTDFMTFSLKEWSILITWIKNNSINIWMCFTLLVRYWLSSYDDQFQRLLAESIYFLFFFFLQLLHPTPIPLQNVGEFWCIPKFSHQTISGQDYIEPEPNLTKSVEKFQWFQWYLNEAATMLIHEDTLLNLKEELP